MASVLNTGVSALNAFRRQMETTGHNIANVHTEGYTRQVVSFDARQPQTSTAGAVGSGVDIASISRSYDAYLANRVREYRATYEEFAVYEQRARQIDNVIADASAGVDEMLQQFFAAVNDVADDPTSISARQVLLNRGEQLSDRFSALDGWFDDMRNQLNRDLETEVSEINSLARALATVNTRVQNLSGTTGTVPSDVLDERDRLIDELSKFTSVSTVEQSDGGLNVFIGTGQALVVGSAYNQLAVANNPRATDEKELVLQQTGGINVNVTAQMTGGSLGGLLRFRDEVLNETQNALGRVAIGIGTYLNEEHRTGMDLDGQLGGNMFTLASPEVLALPTNSGTITVGFDDVADLTTHDYQLDYVSGAWTLTDLNNGATVPLSGTGTVGDPLVAHGMSIVVSAPANGDSYLIRPTRNGADGLDLLITDPRTVAAADPIRTSATTSNAGSGVISPGNLTSLVASPSVPTAPAVTLEYQAGNQLAITGGPAGTQFVDANGSPIVGSVAFTPGQTYRVEIPTLGTFEFTMTGGPQAGDTFTLNDNTGGVGDNRNARRLADMQNANVMIGGTASFADTYGAMIADVGTKTHQANSNAEVQKNLLTQAESAKAEVSGVNLDEEAADLVRFQQAYQAAAQVINVANTLFDSLISAVRR